MNSISSKQILTTDGVPLEISLKKAERINKIKSFLLVSPLLLFILVIYISPIANLLTRSVDNTLISTLLPETYIALGDWDGKSLPSEEIYKIFFIDLEIAHKAKISGKVSTRLNYAKGGFKSLINKTRRKLKNFEDGNYKEQFISIHKKWGDLEYWQAMKTAMPKYTYDKYLNSFDYEKNFEGKIVEKPKNRQVHKMLWLRTLYVALGVTFCCFLLAFPIAHLLATIPLRYSNLLMICVLLPFWTSLLVRTSSWMILLQSQGVINDILVFFNIVSDDNRLELMYNMNGTFIAMTQILLPFMVLPLYSVMKTIPPSLMRAGNSLGGTPFYSFRKIYFPLTFPGIGAGCLLVFILSIGYYITPALVGGPSGTLISNRIAYHMKETLDWGMAAAMGTILLVSVLILYWIYNKLLGIDNLKLG
jgi:putative spermidine/putrescine transport system permease protein|tara:strand:+ start:276 stop:1532 length:1257 start_codon:yes stop_codon:yes gene_type:complete